MIKDQSGDDLPLTPPQTCKLNSWRGSLLLLFMSCDFFAHESL